MSKKHKHEFQTLQGEAKAEAQAKEKARKQATMQDPAITDLHSTPKITPKVEAATQIKAQDQDQARPQDFAKVQTKQPNPSQTPAEAAEQAKQAVILRESNTADQAKNQLKTDHIIAEEARLGRPLTDDEKEVFVTDPQAYRLGRSK
jgi:hypothetical protein